MMNWKLCGGKWSWPILKYYPSICVEGERKTTKTPVTTAGLWIEIQTRVPLNTKQGDGMDTPEWTNTDFF